MRHRHASGRVRNGSGPLDHQRDSDATLVKLALATAERRVRSHVGFASVVAGENEDRIFGKSQRLQLFLQLPDPMINRLDHRRQMRVVILSPVMKWVPLAEPCVFADIAVRATGFSGRMFFPILFNQIRSPIQDGVWRVVTEVQEKWFLLVAFNKINGFQIEAIGQVFARTETTGFNIKPANRLISEDIRPEICPIANRLDLRAKVPLKSMIRRSNFVLGVMIVVTGQMPFPDHTRRIAMPPEKIGERLTSCW